MNLKKQRHFADPSPALFKRLTTLAATRTKDEQGDRALRVFEAFLWGTMAEKASSSEDPSTMADAATNWPDWMDETLRRDLDHKSLKHFIELVLDFYDGASQAERANSGHADSHVLRDEIYRWLDENKTDDMSLDAAAEAMAGKIIPLKFRTVREHCTEWKKLRAAGRA